MIENLRHTKPKKYICLLRIMMDQICCYRTISYIKFLLKSVMAKDSRSAIDLRVSKVRGRLRVPHCTWNTGFCNAIITWSFKIVALAVADIIDQCPQEVLVGQVVYFQRTTNQEMKRYETANVHIEDGLVRKTLSSCDDNHTRPATTSLG
ncbi:hypothetical protein BDW72DRAFT_6005 [Aspergillus terricola var. indicus]